MPEAGILEEVRRASVKKRLYLPHALRQMTRPDRMITTEEVRSVVEHGDLVEDYPDDPRGHSCLMIGFGDGGRPVHVVRAPKDEYLAIITAYLPDPREWWPGSNSGDLYDLRSLSWRDGAEDGAPACRPRRVPCCSGRGARLGLPAVWRALL